MHKLVGAAAAIQRRDDAEVTPDCTAEVYKADNECDFLVSGHYERSYCIPIPKTDGVKESVWNEDGKEVKEGRKGCEFRLSQFAWTIDLFTYFSIITYSDPLCGSPHKPSPLFQRNRVAPV